MFYFFFCDFNDELIKEKIEFEILKIFIFEGCEL